MQNFYDTATNTQYAFEDDVIVTGGVGSYIFTAPHGVVLGPYPSTLTPGTVPVSAAQMLAEAQAAQTASLSLSCAAEIIAGFSSSALGAAYTYPSKPTDQSNLIGAATASLAPGLPSTWAIGFWCADSTGAWAIRQHTAAQIQKVLADAASTREALSTKLASLVTKVQAATTVSAVQTIVW